MPFTLRHKYIIHKSCFLYIGIGFCVVLGVCSVRPAACCYSHDHWGEPRTCCSCLKQTVYFSWESYVWDSCGISKHACLGRNFKSFVLSNSVCGKTCSLSRSVLVNQSVRLMGSPQTIESDDIALVRQHSARERAGNDCPWDPGLKMLPWRSPWQPGIALWELYCVQCVKCQRPSEADRCASSLTYC